MPPLVAARRACARLRGAGPRPNVRARPRGRGLRATVGGTGEVGFVIGGDQAARGNRLRFLPDARLDEGQGETASSHTATAAQSSSSVRCR